MINGASLLLCKQLDHQQIGYIDILQPPPTSKHIQWWEKSDLWTFQCYLWTVERNLDADLEFLEMDPNPRQEVEHKSNKVLRSRAGMISMFDRNPL